MRALIACVLVIALAIGLVAVWSGNSAPDRTACSEVGDELVCRTADSDAVIVRDAAPVICATWTLESPLTSKQAEQICEWAS